MAGRLGRSLHRFSSVNRPIAPAANTSAQDSDQYDGRRYPSLTRHTAMEPQPRSPLLSPRRSDPLPASPTYSITKPTSPTSSPPYRAPAPAARVISSPPKPVHKYPKSPEAKQKPMIHKGVEKVAKSDRYLEPGKTVSSQKGQQQRNAINITGENVGAVMEIVESSKREGGHVIKKKETPRGIVSNIDHIASDEDKEASKDHKAGAQKAPSSPLSTSTFLNSNFQSVNNSLLYDASLAHRDPGLHLAFSRNRTGDQITVDDKKKHHAKR